MVSGAIVRPGAPVVTVAGGGLSGAEAAWQAARRGCRVVLYEMRPEKSTGAHQTGDLAELVCSNSLRGAALENAVGLLKEEMRRLGSLVMEAADATRVPAGGALAVDRGGFSQYITSRLTGHPLVEIRRQELTALRSLADSGPAVVATGPLTSPAMSRAIGQFFGEECLSFFDAAAPIVEAGSIDYSKAFRASRYGRGDDDYLNCPMTEDEYLVFWRALVEAEGAEPHHPDETGPSRARFFEGCLPVEEMARRGRRTLTFGPLKPVGLFDPRTGLRPYAVVQLRQDNAAATHFNLVGFQTNLRWPDQRRVFRMIPGLEEAEFVRYGVMHRNSFIKSPKLLLPTLQARRDSRLLFAGQLTGVEGYVESASAGLIAGTNAARMAQGREPLVFPLQTAIGSLPRYITEANPEHFQPMNIAFGLIEPLPNRPKKTRERKAAYSHRALDALEKFIEELNPQTGQVD